MQPPGRGQRLRGGPRAPLVAPARARLPRGRRRPAHPRPAAELQPDGRVVNQDGVDVSDAYRRGADAAVRLARTVGATAAVLNARSPSCGCHQVYDGSFTRTLVPGEGVTAAALRHAGLQVVSEEDVEADPARLGNVDAPGA